jgi:hypothetical protein
MRNVVFSDPYAAVETAPVVIGWQEVIGKTAVRVTDETGTPQVTAILSSGYDLIKNNMGHLP